MAAVEVVGVQGLKELIGKPIGPTEWQTVTQELIDQFAEFSGDHQWIHVDVERAAKESPFGTTVAHGNLTVTIQSDPVIAQPAPFSNGQTVVTERTTIDVKQDKGQLNALPAGAKLTDVVRALNSLGATPADLLAILQAMKSAGALRAEIEII